MLFFGRIVYEGRESEAEAGERGEGLRRFFPYAGCAGTAIRGGVARAEQGAVHMEEST